MPQPKPYVRADEYGVMRIGDSRVMLDSVVASFQQGHSPETIQQPVPCLDAGRGVWRDCVVFGQYRGSGALFRTASCGVGPGTKESRQKFQSCLATVARFARIKSVCSVMSRPRFLADHDLNEQLVVGVLRRTPEVEFRRVQELGFADRPDKFLLDSAAGQGVLIVSRAVRCRGGGARHGACA